MEIASLESPNYNISKTIVMKSFYSFVQMLQWSDHNSDELFS